MQRLHVGARAGTYGCRAAAVSVDARHLFGCGGDVRVGPARVGRIWWCAVANLDHPRGHRKAVRLVRKLERRRVRRADDRLAEGHRLRERQPETLRTMKGNVAVAGIEHRKVVVAGDVGIADDDVRAACNGGAQCFVFRRVPFGIGGFDVEHDVAAIGEGLAKCGHDRERVFPAEHTVVIEAEEKQEAVRHPQLGARAPSYLRDHDRQRERADRFREASGQCRGREAADAPDLVEMALAPGHRGRKNLDFPRPEADVARSGQQLPTHALEEQRHLVGVDADQVRVERGSSRAGIPERVLLPAERARERHDRVRNPFRGQCGHHRADDLTGAALGEGIAVHVDAWRQLPAARGRRPDLRSPGRNEWGRNVVLANALRPHPVEESLRVDGLDARKGHAQVRPFAPDLAEIGGDAGRVR